MTKKTARAEDEAAAAGEGAASGGDQARSADAAGASAAQPAADPDPAAVAAEWKDRLLRTLADMENLRKRTAREVTDARVYGVAAFARDLLGVADNMRRALETVTPAMRESGEPGVKAFIEGMELTERELEKALEKNGVRRFDPRGEKFDPNFHQAMFEIPNPSVPAGSIVEVVQPGYKLGERVLRPALVGVSKGGQKQAPGAGSANDNSTAPSDNS